LRDEACCEPRRRARLPEEVMSEGAHHRASLDAVRLRLKRDPGGDRDSAVTVN
jgi:hypothetical protein